MINGQLPEGWELTSLGEAADNLDGTRVPLKMSDLDQRHGAYPYYGASGVIDHIDAFLFDGEYLLVAEDGANLLTRSTPIAFLASGRFWVNNHAHVLSFNGKADLSYLQRYLCSIDISRFVTGSAQPKLNQKNLDRVPIPLPPLPEQKRIADILNKADAICRKRQRVVSHFDELLKSTFNHMFGNPIHNPMGWEEERLGDVATLDRGKSRHRPRDAKFLYGGPYPLVQTGDITNSNGFVRVYSQTYSEEGLAQSKLWPAGTLCITIAANIGKTSVLTFDACFPDSVVGLIAGETLTIEYVRHWFVAMEKATDAAATQVTQKNINLEYLRNLRIQVPPIDKQQEFSSAVFKIRQSREHCVAAQNESTTLFNTLIQRAFKGEM